jgi:hypothetical protein
MEENKFLALLSKHWSKIVLGILAIATVAVWSERLFKSNKSEKSQDFFIAQQIFERFQKGEYLAPESIEATQNILERHPELHPKYDPVLALTFFAQQKTPEGICYARSLINHAQQHLPDVYKEYANTTLLISEGKYEEAFREASFLEAKLSEQPGYPTLEAVNTLRLLFLAREIGNTEGQHRFWTKLSQHPSYSTLLSIFQTENLSLSDFFLRK